MRIGLASGNQLLAPSHLYVRCDWYLAQGACPPLPFVTRRRRYDEMRGRRPGKNGGVLAGIRGGFFRAENDAGGRRSFAAVERSMSDRFLRPSKEPPMNGTSGFLAGCGRLCRARPAGKARSEKRRKVPDTFLHLSAILRDPTLAQAHDLTELTNTGGN